MPRKTKKKHKGITPKKDRLGPYYLVRVSRKDPATGETLERRHKVRDTLDAALAAKDDIARQLEAEIGGHLEPSTTLGDYAQQWIAHKAGNLAASTTRKYVNDLERHILPSLGALSLDELQPSHVKAMFARDTGAPNTQRNRLRLLRAIARDAIADRLISWDFTARVVIRPTDVYTEDEPNLLTADELDRLLACFEDEWLDAVHLLAFTGMRWCELAGLQWDDLDLASGVLRIRRANVKGIIGEPKTRKSRRTVGLTADLTARLRLRRQRMLTEQHPGLARGWVFPRPDGEHYRGYPLRNALRRARKAANITIRFTTHGLRRTYNNLARQLGDALVLRAVVGHVTEEMTDHYSQVDVEEKRALSERVAGVVRSGQIR